MMERSFSGSVVRQLKMTGIFSFLAHHPLPFYDRALPFGKEL